MSGAPDEISHIDIGVMLICLTSINQIEYVRIEWSAPPTEP